MTKEELEIQIKLGSFDLVQFAKDVVNYNNSGKLHCLFTITNEELLQQLYDLINSYIRQTYYNAQNTDHIILFTKALGIIINHMQDISSKPAEKALQKYYNLFKKILKND